MAANEGQISAINSMSNNDTSEMLKLIDKADNERAGINKVNSQDPARFKRAAELYRLALEACGCPMGGNHLKTTRTCNIVECVTAVQGDDLGALSALHENPCSCGFDWSACEQPLHAETVDKLAECLEEATLYTRAIQAGFYLVRLDPASPVVSFFLLIIPRLIPSPPPCPQPRAHVPQPCLPPPPPPPPPFNLVPVLLASSLSLGEIENPFRSCQRRANGKHRSGRVAAASSAWNCIFLHIGRWLFALPSWLNTKSSAPTCVFLFAGLWIFRLV